MARFKVSVGSLGGTISMAPSQSGDGIVPQYTAKELIEQIAGVSTMAEVHAEALLNVPSAYIRLEDLHRCLVWAHAQVEAGAAGVILTQGTDTLEESAFYLDLLWDRPEPLILMGAMRGAQAVGAEGPANLLSAIIVAGSANSRGRGVLVVMNDTVHEARWVSKRHTLRVDAFSSQVGAAGVLVEGAVQYFHAPTQRKIYPQPRHCDRQVLLWQNGMSESDQLFTQVVQLYDGIVFAGLGAGHMNAQMAAQVAQIAQDKPVVMTSRTLAGTTTLRTYGYVGSEIDLQRGGVMMGGYLTPLQARILMMLLLNLGLQADAFRQALQEYLDVMTY